MNTEHSTGAGWRNLLLVLGLLAALARAQVVNTPNLNLSEDTDQDGISDADEVALGLDPYNPYNGISALDGAAFIVAWERYLGASSSTVDTDGDGWSDFDEVMVYQTNLFDERSLPGPASSLPAVTTSQPVAASTPTATPSTSLITNGDFSKTNISTWIDGKKLKGYNGSGFEWAAGSVEGWSAYAGSTIEVWNTGTRVVELNGDKSNYGIQQKVETAKPGAYLLTWRSLGRTQEAAPAKNKKTPPAPDNFYFVQVQIGEGRGGSVIKKENFTAGGDGVLVFQLSENDLTDANGKGIYIAFIPTNGSNSYGSLISGVNLLPIDLKVTDFATKSDAVPYVATTNATPPKNSELCLKADKANEKAKIEIELPSITDATMLSKMKWKVVKKPADTLVQEAVFTTTPASVELSLGSGSSVEDEILFEVQVGADGSSFTPAAKINVRVVRDRLNWWFEPFSSDFGWRTAKPEPREDAGDYKRKQIINAAGNLVWVTDSSYPDHHPNAYKRESLQSVYEFFKSSTAIGPSTQKTNWAKPTITCFGQFHDALKTANGNNPLVDLTSLARINMTAVTELPSFDLKYGALRSALGKQTTYPSDANPTLRATQFPERVQFATAAATAVGDANLTRARLMALWTREGSMDVSSQHTRTGYNPWPLGFGAAVSAAPASEADAKAIFIYDVAYKCLGSDFLLKHSGGADNEPDLRDYPAALAHFKSTADATGGAGIGDRIISNLTVAGSAGSYTVSANGAFYEDMLTLAGKHFVSVWQSEGPDATYMAYNMGVAKFNQMKATVGGGSNPERGRLGLIDWAIHYEIRSGEWDQPRDFAQKFHAYRMAFEAKYP